MASTYTSRIRLEKQGDGENANTWGLRLNQNTIDMVDEAVAGYETISVDTLSSITLTSNNGTEDQSRNFALRFTGNLSATCTVVAPASEKVYFISNETTGDQDIIIKSGSASETISVGKPALVAFDGTNSVKLQDTINPPEFESGTSLLFYQAAAPTGWTKQVINDKVLRVVSGSGGSTGGTTAFSTVFSSKTPAGTVGVTVSGHALTVSQIPAHNHQWYIGTGGGSGANSTIDFFFGTPTSSYNSSGSPSGFTGDPDYNSYYTGGVRNLGAASTHTHSATATFTGTALDFDVQYADVIICTKD